MHLQELPYIGLVAKSDLEIWKAVTRVRSPIGGYLTVGVVAQRFVGLIDHHTLDLLGRAGLSGQVVDHDLRREEEDPLGPPHLLSLLGGGAPFRCTHTHRERQTLRDAQRDEVREFRIIMIYLSAQPCAPEVSPSLCNRPRSAAPPAAWWEP